MKRSLILFAMLLLSTAAFATESDCSHANIEEAITEAATCKENGRKELICLDCGETVFVVITPALGHEYVENVIAPTCETAGYTEMVCANCGDHYAVKDTETPALGHNYVTVQETTCAHDGIAECSICHEQITIAALDHTFVYNNDAVTGADGTVISYGTKTCSVCGAIEPAGASDYVAPATPSGEASFDTSGEASDEMNEESEPNEGAFLGFFRSVFNLFLAIPNFIVSLF